MKDFNINERFVFLEQLTEMVCLEQAKSLLLTGEGGLGKTYTTIKTIEKTKTPYQKISGYTTPRGLYNLLYDHNGKLLLFDDCDSVLKDNVSRNVLKIALDSNSERIISWSAQIPKSSPYPNFFEFTGRIIFITNKSQESLKKLDGALLTRGYKVDLQMNSEEKIERMSYLVPKICKENDFNINAGYEALKFLEERKDKINQLSLRSLLDVIRIIQSKKETNWQNLANYCLIN